MPVAGLTDHVPVTLASTSSSEGYLVRWLGQPPPKAPGERQGRHAQAGQIGARADRGRGRCGPSRRPPVPAHPTPPRVNRARGTYPCALGERGSTRLSSGCRHPNMSRGIRGLNTKTRNRDCPSPVSGSRQGWPRRRSPGQRAGPGRHWAPGFAGRARQPAAPSPGVQRAQGARRRCRRFQGRLPGPRGAHGPPPASLSQALKPYKSIHSHLLQALGSRAGSAGTEQKTKAVGEGETLPRKAVWAPGSCSGGSATPARRLQDHSPRLAGSTLPTAS